MTSRFILPNADIGNGISPSDGAKLNFFETGTSTRKDTFSNSAATIKNANPIIADGDGVFPDIFITGTYKVTLTDKNDVQVSFGEADPVDELVIISDNAFVKNFDTLALAVTDTGIIVNDTVNLKERSTGNGGGAIWDVVLASTVTPNTFDIVVSTGDATLAFVYRSTNNISVNALGAIGDTVNDDTAAIQAAFTLAIANSVSFAYTLSGASTSQNPVVNVIFDPATGYRTTSSILVNHPSIGIVGRGRVAITPDNFNDFIFKITGVAFRHKISGFTFESTQAGVFDYEAPDVSGSLVWFDDCRFATDQFLHESGIGIRYRNRSSELRVTQCYFNRIKHPIHNRECDFVTLRDTWLGFALNAVYANKDAYIRNDNGFMLVDRCLFAGGPSAPLNGLGAANGTEVSYFNVGTESVSPDVTEVHGRLAISNTRIGFETGAGALVNYFTPHKLSTDGTVFRSGIYFDNIQTSPREDKKKNIDDLDVAYLIRLFDMPNEISINNIHNSTGNLALITEASTTNLTILREKANVPVNHSDDFATQKSVYSSNDIYQVNGVTCPNLFIVASVGQTAQTQYNQWLELFDKFNYFFDSDFPLPGSGGNNTVINIDTFFTDFTETLGSVFKVQGGCHPGVAGTIFVNSNISGVISITNEDNSNFDRITPFFDGDIDYTAQILGIEITPFFVVAGVEKATITNAEATNATLRIRIRHATSPGSVNVRCRGLVVQPMGALLPSKQNNGFVQA